MQITKPEGLGESGDVEDDLVSATGHLECQSKAVPGPAPPDPSLPFQAQPLHSPASY